MHADTDDMYAHYGWAQPPPAHSLARHANLVTQREHVPNPPGPVGLEKAGGPRALVPGTARSSGRSATHLTRRGRFVLILLATSLVAAAFGAGRASATPARPAGLPTAVVQRGDTLWSIAARIASDGDIRETVEQIRALNGVAAGSLVPGQSLIIPEG